MKSIIICIIAALALAGCIAEPSAALEEGPMPEASAAAPAVEKEAPTPEATDAPVSEPEPAEPEGIAEEPKRDSITEGLICHMEGWAEACRAPDLIDMGLAPLPDGTPVTDVTEEQVQELKPAKAKRPGVPKTGY